MSKIKNGGLDQYGAEPFEQRQFGTAGVGGVKAHCGSTNAIESHFSNAVRLLVFRQRCTAIEISQ